MKYIMGIDQGSSKTHVIIGNDVGEVLGFGKSYGACHSDKGMDFAMSAVSAAAGEAFRQAKIHPLEIEFVVAGMTGADWDFEMELLEKALISTLGISNILVKNDCIIAMRGGTLKSYGAVICAGSGLNCAIQGPDGSDFVYSYYIDDEYQGGSALGRACVRAAIESEVGLVPPTQLTQLVLKYLECSNVHQLLYKRVTGQISAMNYLHLPVIVEKAASLGDKVAQDILTRFGKQFARYIICALQKMNLLETPMEVVLSGSIFKCKEPQLRNAVINRLAQEAKLAKVVDAVYEPVVGAYLFGLDRLGIIAEIIQSELDNSTNILGLKRLE